MRVIIILIIHFLHLSVKAQITNLPELHAINGVTKTVMNPKLYPLLLKVHVSENSTNTTDFKNFIEHLKHFEVFTSDNLTSGDTLFSKTNSFVSTQLYKEVNANTYQLITPTQKEYLIIKQNLNNATIVYAFTTKPEYNDIKKLKLM